MIVCNLCATEFTQKSGLNRHLRERRCKVTIDLVELNEKIENLKNLENNKPILNCNNNNNNNNTIVNGNGNVINNNIIININPISKLDVSYIDPIKMKELVENYQFPSLTYLLSNYIKEIIHNKDHPENHSIKYIKMKPPTFSSKIGENINVIKNLKDSCELLSEPVLANLKKKLKECNKVYKNDEDFQNMYEDTVRDIYRELNKESVKKALSTVLQIDILNDIEMKINIDIIKDTIKEK